MRARSARGTTGLIDDLKKKLDGEVLPATWAALEPHARRQALFLVREGLELAVVAAAVAADDQAQVKVWIDDGSLRRPTVEEVTAWAAEPVAFDAVIVQPFVLCRPMD